MDYVSVGLTGFSIFISLVLFWIGYKETIGAKKQRIDSTYREIVKILVRNLVNLNYVPTISEINRILQTKSTENKISVNDLPEEIKFIYALYARVSEDEILSADKKKELIDKINDYLEEIEKKAPSIIDEEKERLNKETKYVIPLILFSVGVGISVAFFLITNLLSNIVINFEIILAIITSITAVVAITSTYTKFKEEQEEPKTSRKSVINEGRIFEDEIFKIIKDLGETKRGVDLRKDNIILNFDFSLKKGDKTFLIEVKNFQSYASSFIIHELTNRARHVKDKDKNCILILVVNNKRYFARYLDELSKTWDYIFDENELREFRNGLLHKAK